MKTVIKLLAFLFVLFASPALAQQGLVSQAISPGNLSGLGTGVATALGVNVGSAGAVVVNGGALGTPSSGILTSATGLPVSTGISGLGTGVATALAVNIGSSGAFVSFGGALGSPSSVGTLPAFTLGGAITGGGNQINGVVIGAANPGLGTFTGISVGNSIITLTGGVTGASPAPQITMGSYFDNAGNPSVSHIDLFGGSFGFGISGSAFNAISGTSFAWYTNSTLSASAMSLSTAGALSVPGTTNVATTSALCINTSTGLITYDGTLGTCTISDERVKDIEGPIVGALDKLLQISGFYYTWKDVSFGSGHQIGVGAQTVEKVFPELVQTDSTGRKSVDYQRLVAPIIEAIRELKAENDNLRSEVQRGAAR